MAKTLQDLLTQLREQAAGLVTQRTSARDEIMAVRTACADETRDPSTEEAAQVRAADAKVKSFDAEIDAVQARIAEFEAELERDNTVARLQSQSTPTGLTQPDVTPGQRSPAVVTSEPRTYTRQNDKAGKSRFFSDAWNAERGNSQAKARIERHGREVEVHGEMSERALNTGGIAGLTVPQYLVDMAAPVLRNGRPLANLATRHELPDEGMSFVVPRGTTGASAAAQATENSSVSNTDEVWANLTIPVCTVAGQQAVSRQALERGTQMDEIVFMDLVRAHASQLDNYCINGSGASGQPLGILNTSGIGAATAFGAVPGAANFSLKVAGQIAGVTSQGAGIYPTYIFMHPRRWGWLTGLLDSSNRPIVEASQMGLYNALASILAPGKAGMDPDPVTSATVVGTHTSGLPIVTDLNIPINVGTNVEDVVLVADTNELHLWEDGDGLPRQLSFEQTAGNNLTTTLVVYSYIAFTAGRYPGATGKIGGLDSTATFGLVAPSF